MILHFVAAFDARRIASIDDDDFAEYDVTEHFELSQGIPERLGRVSHCCSKSILSTVGVLTFPLCHNSCVLLACNGVTLS